MADLNRVTLVGRLTRDPELRQTAGGTSVASLRLACTSRTNRGGEWSDQSNFFDITVFGKQAENVDKYLDKGRRIGIDGRLSWREWEAKDGSKRQSVEVIASEVFFLDSKGAAPTGRDAGGSDMPVDDVPASTVGDDDVPF